MDIKDYVVNLIKTGEATVKAFDKGYYLKGNGEEGYFDNIDDVLEWYRKSE